MQILIAGLAKTGTTGLLYLLNSSLPRAPKMLFEPKSCSPDLLEQYPDLLAKVIIDAKLEIEGFKPFSRKITIVRDPRDRLVSALLYSQYHADYLNNDERVALVRACLQRKEAQPGTVPIAEILRVMSVAGGKSADAAQQGVRLRRAMQGFDDYVAATPDALLYKYEDFVEERYAPLANHLGLPITGAAEVPDRLKRVERTKDAGDWRNWFTPADVEVFRPALADWLERYGYDPNDWRLNDPQTIDPQHCSAYFMRLVEESRAKSQQSAPPPPSADSPTRPASGRRNTGSVLRAEPSTVVGWAIGPQINQPVTLSLQVNGREVAQTVANKARPALAERGIHPTGRCGFVFRLRETERLHPGDQVTVVPVGAQFMLKNSPRTVTEHTAS